MIYFDNSATSRYKPKSEINEMKKALIKSSNGGRGSHHDATDMALKISKTRTFLCEKLNANEVIFTKNATEAINIVIFGTLKRGDHVITSTLEHNAILRPLFFLEKEGLITLTIINPNNQTLLLNPTHIERSIKSNTSLIALSGVSNVTGVVQDIESIGNIAKSYNVPFLLDGAQTLPHLNINMKEMGISYMAIAGHKGLHGPQGTGALAINKISDIKPLILGGTGTNSDSVYMPHALPESLEAGTLNGAGIIGLFMGAMWTYNHIIQINKKIEQISDTILKGLYGMKGVTIYTPYNTKTGVITFNILDKDSSEIGDILNNKYDIAVRTGLHCAPLIHNFLGTLERGAVRVSVGYNNKMSDAKYLLKAISDIVKEYK